MEKGSSPTNANINKLADYFGVSVEELVGTASPVSDSDTIDRLFDLLAGSELKQQEFADALGVKKNAITRWKNRELHSYTKYIPQIADILGTTTEYLLTGTGKKYKASPVSESDTTQKQTAAINIDILIGNILALCKAKGIAPRTASRESGAGDNFLVNLRNGSIPSVSKVQSIAQYLGCTTSELLGETSPVSESDTTQNQAAAPQDSSLVDEFTRLFAELTPENQNVIIAEMLRRRREG